MYPSTPLFDLFDEVAITNAAVTTWISRIIGLIVVWIIVWILVRYLSRWIRHLDSRVEALEISRRDLKTLDRLLDYITILIGLIISLAILGWTSLLYSALTAAGLFSVMMGFAVKDVAANFVSGVFILVDQPFAPGDFIAINEYSGTVDKVSLRTTTLVTLDGPIVHIPNSILAVQPTINYSIAETRRIKFTISVDKDADINRALTVVNQVLADEKGLSVEQTPSVLVTDVREYAVDIEVICYAPGNTWLELSSDLKQQVMTALQQADVELAVPVRKNVNLDLPAARVHAHDE